MELDLEHPLPLPFPFLTSNNNSQDLNFDPSLFHIESQHMPSNTAYITTTNKINPEFDDNFSFRRQTISLIINLSHNFDPFLSYLAINYLHRFLSHQSNQLQEGKPWILKLLAVCCISLALKMRKTEHPVTDVIQQTILRMELLILGALKWRTRSITPFSFINFFVTFFKFKDPPLRQALKARATQIIFKSQLELKFWEFKPSIIAASALLSASHELFPLQFQCFKKAISTCSYVNKVSFVRCNNVMQEIAMDGYESVLETVSSTNTPVNGPDRQWPCSSSESENRDTEYGTIGVEMRDFKRRKISSFRTTDETFQLSQIHQN